MLLCRLIIDPPGDGVWNMALDEALLEAAESDGSVWLRLYSWREPTLSLGYFQAHADRRQHRASASCPIVRRSSGGGAILHDRELTYSLAVPRSHSGARNAEGLYETVHESLVEALADLGVKAALHHQLSGQAAKQAAEPFLCFERRATGDVLVGANKVAGSAQRRRRGAVLEHGSILLAQSEFAPELLGLAELTGTPEIGSRLTALWLKRLERRLEVTFTQQLPAAEVVANAQRIAAEKFATTAWAEKK